MDEYKLRHGIVTGGLVALAFDPNEKYLFVVTHSGRGVYDINTGERIARDYEVKYPEHGIIPGIGPLNGNIVTVVEYDFKRDLTILSKSGKYRAIGESSYIKLEERN
jgi:hypothetical protein